VIHQLLIANPTLENFSDLIPVPEAMELTHLFLDAVATNVELVTVSCSITLCTAVVSIWESSRECI
jgi:hypothetical protein